MHLHLQSKEENLQELHSTAQFQWLDLYCQQQSVRVGADLIHLEPIRANHRGAIAGQDDLN